MKWIATCLVALVTLTGCGSGGLPGETYAVEACGITKPSGSGVWTAPSLSPSDTFWTLGDPLSDHRYASTVWAENAIAATRAARENSRYEVLRVSAAEISAMRSSVLSWASSDPAKHARWLTLPNSDFFLQQGLALEARLGGTPGYNDLLQTWKIECNAIADELNS